METVYKRLFNTRITHTFYEGGISKKDLAVFPTEETVMAMKNANMLFRKDEQGFRVFYRDDGSGNAFIPFSNVNLVFGIQLLNINEFMNFTNLDDASPVNPYTPGKVLYFNNLGTETVNDLNYSLIDYLRPASFTYTFPQTAPVPGAPSNTGMVVIKDEADNIVTPTPPPASTGIVSDQNGKWHYPVDFTKMSKGLYKFETTVVSPPGTTTQTIYIDTALARQGVFGIVKILAIDEQAASYPGIPGPLPSPIPDITTDRVYDMNFVRRTTFWKYIVVLKSGSVVLPATGLGITDTNPGQAPFGTLVFTRKNDIKVNGIDAVEFTSFSTIPPTAPDTSPIPFFEGVKTGLDIIKASDTIASDIANPAFALVSGAGTTVSPTEIFVII